VKKNEEGEEFVLPSQLAGSRVIHRKGNPLEKENAVFVYYGVTAKCEGRSQGEGWIFDNGLFDFA